MWWWGGVVGVGGGGWGGGGGGGWGGGWGGGVGGGGGGGWGWGGGGEGGGGGGGGGVGGGGVGGGEAGVGMEVEVGGTWVFSFLIILYSETTSGETGRKGRGGERSGDIRNESHLASWFCDPHSPPFSAASLPFHNTPITAPSFIHLALLPSIPAPQCLPPQ